MTQAAMIWFRRAAATAKPGTDLWRDANMRLASRLRSSDDPAAMTAANDLGFTTAVPARIEVLVDARLKPIKLGKQEIQFKPAAPSRLYWAGRPAMRVVQALH